MDPKSRAVLPVLMSSVMVFAVTFAVTVMNFGFRADFVSRWMKAYCVAWPVAAVTGFCVLPTMQRFSAQIVEHINRRT